MTLLWKGLTAIHSRVEKINERIHANHFTGTEKHFTSKQGSLTKLQFIDKNTTVQDNGDIISPSC